MIGILNILFKRAVGHLFRRVPALYRCIEEQCDIAIEAVEIFLKYSGESNEKNLAKIETVNSHRHEVNSRVYDILNIETEMPADIKGIYRAFLALDLLINHIRISTREMGMQQLNPDEHMRKMALFLKVGIESLRRGFKNLTDNRGHVRADAYAARSAAYNTKSAFNYALTDMLPAKQEMDAKSTKSAIANLKRHIVYIQLSETADRVTWASQQLYSLSVTAR